MILLQVISALFAVLVALHDAPAVSNAHFYGWASPKYNGQFHAANAALKVVFSLMAALPYFADWKLAAVAFVLSGLWVYLLFDPVLNLARSPKFAWWYLGVNDGDGRRWRAVFGEKAGKVKAAILFILIIGGNILWQIISK